MIGTKYFYIAELVEIPILAAHYGDHYTKPWLYGEFLKKDSDGRVNSIFYTTGIIVPQRY